MKQLLASAVLLLGAVQVPTNAVYQPSIGEWMCTKPPTYGAADLRLALSANDRVMTMLSYHVADVDPIDYANYIVRCTRQDEPGN